MKKLNKILQNNIIFYALMLIILGLFVYALLPLPKIIGEYNQVKTLNNQKLKEKTELERQLTLVNNEQLRLDMARELYKISKDGEIIFVFPEDENKNTQQTVEQNDKK